MKLEMNFEESNQNFEMNVSGAVVVNGGGGNDGFSPVVEVEAIEGGNRVTITDKDGEKSFDVMDGKDGENGGYYEPSVQQFSDDQMLISFFGSDGSMPNVSQVEITLPKGADGKTPQKGVDYFDGKDGTDGLDGYTPQKGTDYWTEEDKKEIVEDVLEQIPETPSGCVSADWQQNDPTAPDYVKNRTHWKETFPPIEWDGSTEGRDSFDATAMGFGVLYKVSDQVWTKEQAENCEAYGVLADDGTELTSYFLYNGILLEDDVIGFAALYGDEFAGIVLFFAKQAIDLTAVYGFAIPSAGCYAFQTVPIGWNGTVVGWRLPPVFHKLGDEYLPDDILRDGQLNLFPLIQHSGMHPVYLPVDGGVVSQSNIFGENEETDARIDDALGKGMASFDVYFGDDDIKDFYECKVILISSGYNSKTHFGSCVVKDGDRRIVVNLEISKDLGIYNLWAETLVTKSCAEKWTFTLEDGTTVTKDVVVM